MCSPANGARTSASSSRSSKIEVDQDTGEEEEVKFGLLKTYCVFNADQVEGEHLDKFRVGELTPATGVVDSSPPKRPSWRRVPTSASAATEPSMFVRHQAEW